MEKRKIAVGFMLVLVAFSMSSMALTTPATARVYQPWTENRVNYYYPLSSTAAATAYSKVELVVDADSSCSVAYALYAANFLAFAQVALSYLAIVMPVPPYVVLIPIKAAIYYCSLSFEVESNKRGTLYSWSHDEYGWWEANNLVAGSPINTVGAEINWNFDPVISLLTGESITATARVSADGLATWMDWTSWPVTQEFSLDVCSSVFVFGPSGGGGGGGGGGCPNLLVFDGTEFADEGVLSIHNFTDPESDVVVQHSLIINPAVDQGKCTLKLAEIGAGYSESHSWIDQVKLYAINDKGSSHRCPLVSADSSRDGNVLPLLSRSDDRWAQTFKGDEITLQFKVPKLGNVAQFVFVIEGHNMKTAQ